MIMMTVFNSIGVGSNALLSIGGTVINSSVNIYRTYRDTKSCKTAQVFLENLYLLEKIPIGSSSYSRQCLEDARRHCQSMAACTSQWAHNLRQSLKRATLAQEYRLRNIKEDNSSQTTIIFGKLSKLAKQWKQGKHYYTSKELTQEENNQLWKASTYYFFAKLLLESKDLQEDFFQWILPNDTLVQKFSANDAEVFIKFPQLYQNALRDLGSRSSRFGGELFSVDSKKQVVKMMLEGKSVKVIDGKTYVLKGHSGKGKLTLTISQIFDEIKKKINTGFGNVEACDKGGFWNYNPVMRGPYNEDEEVYDSIDLSQPDWLLKMPKQETMTKEEAKQRFGVDLDLPEESEEIEANESEEAEAKESEETKTKTYDFSAPGTKPALLYMATKKGERQIQGTHSFYGFLTLRKNGKVDFRTIGQFAYPFPIGWWKSLLFLPAYHSSAMYFLDENIFASNREHAAFECKSVTPDKWHNILESIKKDAIKGDNGKLGFHYAIANCTANSCKKLTHHLGDAIPNLRLHVWDLNLCGGEGYIFNTFKIFPSTIRNLMLRIFFFVFGSWRGTTIAHKDKDEEYVSLLRGESLYNKTKSPLFHPSGLFEAEKKPASG